MAFNLLKGVDDGKVCHGDGSSSWVTVNLRVCSNLMNGGNLQTRLFLQLTMAHCSVVSSIFMNPPGKAQQPLYGSAPLSIKRTCGTASFVITTQSAVTAGLGYLYVYSIISNYFAVIRYSFAPFSHEVNLRFNPFVIFL